jgi:hypothetical protein
MFEDPDPIVISAQRLCETLERIGDALVTLDADTLLDTEATLEQLLAALASGHAVRDRAALESLVRRAADALLRCRRLGASYSAIAGTRLRICAGVETYGRDGEFVEAAPSGSAVKVSA